MTKRLLSLAPVLLFAAALAVMQWISGAGVTSLALTTVLVFLLTTTVVRLLPWRRWVLVFRPGSAGYLAVLFALFVRHFAGILSGEARRVLTARSLAVPRRFGRGAFRSLVHAVVSVFSRSLTRAERFYAAQWLRGIAE